MQDVAGADRRQLVGVADHNEPAVERQGVHECCEQHHVHHGQLVHDDGVRLNGVAGVAGKAHLLVTGALRLQKTVDGLRLFPGDLGHALGGAARGGRQDDMEAVRLQKAQDGVDRGGLAGAWAAGQDEDAFFDGGDNGLSLPALIVDAGLPFDPLEVPVQRGPARRREAHHHLDALGAVVFRVEDVRQEHELPPVDFGDPQKVLFAEVVDGNVDGVVVGGQKVRRRPEEFLPGQAGVSVVQVMVHDVQDARFDAEARVRLLAEGGGQRVHAVEGHADVRKAEDVRVLPDHLHDIVSEYLVRVDGLRGRQAEVFEGHHHFPHGVLFFERCGDLLRLFRGDAAYFGQALRVVAEDVEGLLPKGLNDFYRSGGANALDGAAGEIFQHLGHGPGHAPFTELRPELPAERGMGVPAAGKAQFLPCRYFGQDADDGDELAVFRGDVQHGKTGVLSAEYQFFCNAFQHFQFGLCQRPHLPAEKGQAGVPCCPVKFKNVTWRISRVLSSKATIYLGRPLLTGSSHPSASQAEQASQVGVAPDRVYIAMMSPPCW